MDYDKESVVPGGGTPSTTTITTIPLRNLNRSWVQMLLCERGEAVGRWGWGVRGGGKNFHFRNQGFRSFRGWLGHVSWTKVQVCCVWK